VYQKQFYKQIHGIAMGNPLAPTVAAIYMDHHIKNTIHKMPDRPRFFKKYVDDCITEVKVEDIDGMLMILNSYDENIRFTYEAQKNNVIQFLDMSILSEENNFNYITDWFQKKTASGRILNYNSCHPARIKRNVVKELSNRILSLSHPKFWEKNIKEIKNILKQNNYPSGYVNSIIKKKIQSLKIPKIIITPPEPPEYRSLTYIESMSENLEKLFHKEIP